MHYIAASAAAGVMDRHRRVQAIAVRVIHDPARRPADRAGNRGNVVAQHLTQRQPVLRGLRTKIGIREAGSVLNQRTGSYNFV